MNIVFRMISYRFLNKYVIMCCQLYMLMNNITLSTHVWWKSRTDYSIEQVYADWHRLVIRIAWFVDMRLGIAGFPEWVIWSSLVCEQFMYNYSVSNYPARGGIYNCFFIKCCQVFFKYSNRYNVLFLFLSNYIPLTTICCIHHRVLSIEIFKLSHWKCWKLPTYQRDYDQFLKIKAEI